jgi:hypothetical protein
MARSRNIPDGYDVGGIAVAGSLLIGWGIGATQDQAGAGILIGLGVGLILMAVLRILPRNW